MYLIVSVLSIKNELFSTSTSVTLNLLSLISGRLVFCSSKIFELLSKIKDPESSSNPIEFGVPSKLSR